MQRLAAEVRWKLRTVEKNPGPGVRRVFETRRETRRRGRHTGRRERRQGTEQGEEKGGEGVVVRDVITWNVQRVSLREVNWSRMRRVVA